MSSHVWILGVKNRYRGLELERQLARNKITFTNFWGEDAEAIVTNPALAKYEKKFVNFALGRPLTPGEEACARGHLAIFEEFLNTNHEWALILEDDARLIDNLDFLREGLPYFQESVLIAIHDGPGYRFTKPDTHLKRVIDQFIPVQRLLELPSCANGYLFNRNAVGALNLVKARELLTVADWPYVFSYKYFLYASVEPLITTAENNNSLIGERGNLQTKHISFWVPRPSRVIIALKYGIDFKLALYREIVLKIKRVYHKCLQNFKE